MPFMKWVKTPDGYKPVEITDEEVVAENARRRGKRAAVWLDEANEMVKGEARKGEEMKLYKNEDLCIGCKNAFFSKPYDHRDPTPGQLGYCIECDNFLIKDKKMEFDKSRVYTSVNADELKQGDKVITANCLADLKTYVAADAPAYEIDTIHDDTTLYRFEVRHLNGRTCIATLAYLVERKENCTNCRLCNGAIKDDPTEVCENYEPQVEPPANCETCSKADTDRCPVPNPPKETGCCHWEARPARVCENCRNLERHGKDNNWCEVRELKLSDEAIKKNTCGYLKLVKTKTERPELVSLGNGQYAEKPKTTEKHYRPFKDTDELIKVWEQKWSDKTNGQKWHDCKLNMPLIWVKHKERGSQELITTYNGDMFLTEYAQGDMEKLLEWYTFLDGSSCGVEE